MATTNAVTNETAEFHNANPKIMECLQEATRRSGRRPASLLPDLIRLMRGRGKITPREFVQFNLFDPAMERADQERFIGAMLHWPIVREICDMTWQASTEDKWLNSVILANAGMPTPNIVGVIDKTSRAFPNTAKIQTADDLRGLVRERGGRPFFGKENRGICSFGVFQIEDGDDSGLSLKGKGQSGYDAFLNGFVGDTPYLLQDVETNHTFFDRYTKSLATVRVCLLLTDAGVKIPFTVLKLAGGENLADAFWRPENVACDVNPETGEIRKARTKTPLSTTDHEEMPGTGQKLIGETIPHWDELIRIATETAHIFEPVCYQSMDIAVTERGPVIIEVNTGGGFDLPQLASGRGFLTDEVLAFLCERGCKRF